jgi:hypothetical protein
MNGQSADEMTKTEFPPAMISRPVYGVLEPRPGAFHLIVADGEGAEAVAEMVAKSADPAAMQRSVGLGEVGAFACGQHQHQGLGNHAGGVAALTRVLQEANEIGDAGAAGLGEGLKVNSSLQKLHLVRLVIFVCGWFVVLLLRERAGGSLLQCRELFMLTLVFECCWL